MSTMEYASRKVQELESCEKGEFLLLLANDLSEIMREQNQDAERVRRVNEIQSQVLHYACDLRLYTGNEEEERRIVVALKTDDSELNGTLESAYLSAARMMGIDESNEIEIPDEFIVKDKTPAYVPPPVPAPDEEKDLQKLVTIYISTAAKNPKHRQVEEYLEEYFAEGWKIKQMTALGGSNGGGGMEGWIAVLLEKAKEPNWEDCIPF